MIRLADRASIISPSTTLAIAARAKTLAAAGLEVYDFSIGEPDFDTPAHIREAAKRALDEGKTRYAPAAGVPRLRELVADKLRRENHLPYTPDQVMISTGGKQAILNVMLAVLGPGDEVLIPAPYWVSYPEIAKLARSTPVILPTEASNGYKVTPEQVRQAITPRTKMLILNSPSNPTGTVYTRAELFALAEVLVEKQIAVLADEMYEKLIYDGAEHVSIGSLGPEIFELTLTCNGFSKAYAATGWRLGYAAGPNHVIKTAIDIQSHTTSGATTFAQYGAIAALEGPQDAVEAMRREFEARRNLMYEGIRALGLSCPYPQGAFYVFPSVAPTGLDGTAFCSRVLEEQHVVCVPGEAFGAPDCVRFSYATSRTVIEKGLAALERFLQRVD